jgi:hypothetical protein
VFDCAVTTNEDLIQLLRRREEIIADHAWRDRDSSGQLQALQQVSEEITAWATAREGRLDPRLRHFLANASFAKALAHLQQNPEQ